MRDEGEGRLNLDTRPTQYTTLSLNTIVTTNFTIDLHIILEHHYKHHNQHHYHKNYLFPSL